MNIVERLKDSLEYEYNLSFSERKQLLEEIDRLNNIINELEKWIKHQPFLYIIKYKLEEKLQELKENK